MFEVYVAGLAFDMLSKSPVVLLRPTDGGEDTLPIWIGANEAAVIALELSDVAPRRPLTHDLLKAVIVGLNANLQRILISTLAENTYFAKFYLTMGEHSVVEIDARPSDSIAMALKMEAPIFVADELRDAFIDLHPDDDIPLPDDSEVDPMDLQRRLRTIRPDDFGSFFL